MANLEQVTQIYALSCVLFRDEHPREEETLMENK